MEGLSLIGALINELFYENDDKNGNFQIELRVSMQFIQVCVSGGNL
jgi:hypothetical protein